LICYGVSVEVSSTEVEVLGAAAIQIDTWSNALVVKLILSDIATYSSSLNVISSSALDCTHETNHPPSVSIYLPLASDIERPSSCTGIGVGSGHLQRERERERELSRLTAVPDMQMAYESVSRHQVTRGQETLPPKIRIGVVGCTSRMALKTMGPRWQQMSARRPEEKSLQRTSITGDGHVPVVESQGWVEGVSGTTYPTRRNTSGSSAMASMNCVSSFRTRNGDARRQCLPKARESYPPLSAPSYSRHSPRN
jgi:hypothetical protein